MAIQKNVAREMMDEVLALAGCCTLWRELLEPSNVWSRFNHRPFLETVAIETLASFCVRMFQLFDHRTDTKSLRRLIEDLRLSNPTLAQQLDSKIAPHETDLAKVTRLRHNVYAHRNKARQPQDFFAEVGLKPRIMRELLTLAQDVMVHIAVAAAVGSKAELEKECRDRQQEVLDDTRKVLDILSSDHKPAEVVLTPQLGNS